MNLRDDRYGQGLEDDDKSGYRPAMNVEGLSQPPGTGLNESLTRPIQAVEGWLLDCLFAMGGQPLDSLVIDARRIGIPERQLLLAVLRLQSVGKVVFSVPDGVVAMANPKPLPGWRRFLRWALGQGGTYLIAAVFVTACACIIATR